jgi:hypothetical protein
MIKINDTLSTVIANVVTDMGYFITVEFFPGSKYKPDASGPLSIKRYGNYRITTGVTAEEDPGKGEQEQQVIWLSELEMEMLRQVIKLGEG